MVSKGHDFIILGGTTRTGDHKIVVKFSVHTSGKKISWKTPLNPLGTGEWSQMGYLRQNRSGHAAVLEGDSILVFG